MEKRYKKPPIDEMYMGVYFQVSPTMGELDFHLLHADSYKNKGFTKIDNIYVPAPPLNNNTRTQIEKIVFKNDDETRFLQIASDRLIFNWRRSASQGILDTDFQYPKYEKIKRDFLEYWNVFRKYINKYPNRTIKIRAFALYYANIFYSDIDSFFKENDSITKVITLPSFWIRDNNLVKTPIVLRYNIDQDKFVFTLSTGKDQSNKKGLYQSFLMEKNAELVETIDENWYNGANKALNEMFEDMVTSEAKFYYRGD